MRDFISTIAKKKLPGKETFEILTKNHSHDTISLGMGEPDLQLPENIFDCCAMKSEYSPPSGIQQLKNAICRKLEKENRISAQPENIVVTCGATEGLFLSGLATVNPKDEIIIPDPTFIILRSMFEIFGSKSVPLQLREQEKFKLNTDDMRKAVTSNTKIIVLNSPSNPTGAVFDKKLLEEVADIAIEHDLLVFSDEAYENLIYEGHHNSIASLNGMIDRVVSFYTFSKTWAIPGFRLGYLCAPPDIAQSITKLHPYTTICAPTISQILGTYLLENSDNLRHHIVFMRNEYKKRRDLIVRRLNELGLRTMNPEGAFYTFSDISSFSGNSIAFANTILKKAKVAVVPGSEFGKYGEGYVRCSYTVPICKIEEAMNRIENNLKHLNC